MQSLVSVSFIDAPIMDIHQPLPIQFVGNSLASGNWNGFGFIDFLHKAQLDITEEADATEQETGIYIPFTMSY